jgi:uncharacterized cupredoxin-like copper-binding protein
MSYYRIENEENPLVRGLRLVRPAFVLIQLILLALALAACSKGDAAPVRELPAATAAAPAKLMITAADFHFQAPRTTPAGITTIHLLNNGPDFHHVQLVRLKSGHTPTELVELFAKGAEQLPEWATFVGGPNSPAPGAASEATLDLEAGEYALVCIIPGSDGIPHLMKGMVVPLTVTPSTTTAAEPVADVQLVLKDYGFDISPEIAAGKHTIRVTNSAEQPHEVFIVKLEPGKNAPDLLNWLAKPQGPPPAMPLGGTTNLDTGESNYLTMDLTPGEYAFYCFVPDAKDHQPHFAHGMVKQITVK